MSDTSTDSKFWGELQSTLKDELENLRKKEYLSYWPRFLIRRIPLYAIPFLMFFTFFFCLSLTKKIGVEKVNNMLGTLSISFSGCLLLGIVISIVMLFLQWMMFNCKYNPKNENEVVEHCKHCKFCKFCKFCKLNYKSFVYNAILFFIFFFCLSLTKEIVVEKVNNMLGTLSISFSGCLLLGIVIFIVVLLLQWMMFNCKYNPKKEQEQEQGKEQGKEKEVVESRKLNYKLFAHVIFVFSYALLFVFIYHASNKVFYGFIVFFILTFLPLIIDRVLGVTRQNERLKLYIRRLERFDKLNDLREKKNIKFKKSYFIEYMMLVDELDHSKNQDTVSDTSYLMKLIENKLKT